MAHREKPMFEYIKENADLVKCSKEKFESLPFNDRMKCVWEEAYVIALERAIIPMMFRQGPATTPEKAMKWALMRICTNLTSGWFREFALLNYTTLSLLWDKNYVDKFLAAVDNGTIKQIGDNDENTKAN